VLESAESPAAALFDLTDRVVVVTGGTQGLGRSMVVAFARCGAEVVVVSRRREACEDVAAEVREAGGKAHARPCHVGHWDALEPLVDGIYEQLGRIDVLVNNMGGGGTPMRLHKLTDDDWQQGFELNFFSSVRTSGACLPTMLERGWGRIVHIASTYGVEPGPLFGPYSAAKAALLNYSKNLSHAYAAQGVLSNVVIPGITITEAINENASTAAEAQGVSPDEVMAKMMERDPVSIGRFGDPQEVAAAVVFLASEPASWITGSTLAVDGGTLRSI
jgi:NAD(P)-dependent dehydrogenase (short-subunit alcohol dehydrogenase family)